MAAMVDEYLDTPMDNDDVFPCKGCGEILEEGKAFELAGNRWHLDCFRCNTCSTLLDSDANLLLLGDGSLICNNCTYSCSACNNKIEDLAILTGEQAFCATCFRCRNCKRKIENLRYARTSQGIFCMACHETLMARRRKKTKAAAAAKARDKELSPMLTEKSLPALPPNVIPNGAFSNDRVDPDSDTPTELSPRPRATQRPTDSSSRASSRPARSPERQTEPRSEGLSLPTSSYRKNRNSAIMMPPDGNTNDSGDSYFISVALDPSPGGHTATPRSGTDSVNDPKKKDYFSIPKSNTLDKRNDSVSSAHHIAFQERGRQYSSDFDSKAPARKFSKSSQGEQLKSTEKVAPANSKLHSTSEEFKLQDAPNTKKLAASSSAGSQLSTPALDGTSTPGSVERKGKESAPSSRGSEDSRHLADDEVRPSLDLLPKAPGRADNLKATTRKELPTSVSSPANGKARQQVKIEEPPAAGGRQAPQRTATTEQKSNTDTYMQPRTAPAPPTAQNHTAGKESVSSKDDQLSPKVSPKLPRWSSGGSFSMDEDMARILGTDEGSSSILRRVSNVVRHGRTNSVETGPNQPRLSHTRSISETARASMSPRWPKTPLVDEVNGQAHDISSPLSVTSVDDPALLKRQLRNSEQRVAELERQFNTEKDLKSLNQRLIEKRKTVSVLDTQTEIMIRQLEVLAGYVERAKDTKTPIDPRELEDSAIKEFVQKLEQVKEAMSESIAELHEDRDRLVEEKNQAMADRDRALLEFEQLSSKNAQLADMNNDLTHQIQGRFKSHMGADSKVPNGLGIYGQNKAAMSSSVQLETASTTTGTTLVSIDDEPILEAGPTVVQVRKGQAKKFNWKKGSKTMAQNITKGVGRAVVAFQNDRGERIPHPQGGFSGDNIGMPYNATVTQIESPVTTSNGQARLQGDAGRQGFGFFSSKKTNTMPKSTSALTVAAPPAEAASVLFGSDLSERADYERRQIPSVVTRCIEEVELRGMDQEGIYRKTGGNSQVNMIKDGFDRDENYDISDPDLDITAVTSVLKQYFRKLPTPLLTFDVYERVLESNAVVDPTERCQHLQKTFSMMPQRHWDCLEFLMFHLQRVAKRESENLMSPKNLAVVFAPTIMRDLSIEREMTDMHAKNLAIQFVIENSHRIFDDA
ncbi:N-chimaerin [Paramyrothecium foliicola]|nr:N-chimaerin [Paramyrothecium foliicola]